MIKKLLPLLSLGTFLLVSTIQPSAQAGNALCVIKNEYNETVFNNQCNFEQFGGNGSFIISSKSGLIANQESISVYILKPGVAEVRGLTTGGINSRWGEARRSNSDKACWLGTDFSICAY